MKIYQKDGGYCIEPETDFEAVGMSQLFAHGVASFFYSGGAKHKCRLMFYPMKRRPGLVGTVDIKQLRKKMELNQTEFGRYFGVDHSTISRWEQGVTRPNKEQIAQLKTMEETVKE